MNIDMCGAVLQLRKLDNAAGVFALHYHIVLAQHRGLLLESSQPSLFDLHSQIDAVDA